MVSLCRNPATARTDVRVVGVATRSPVSGTKASRRGETERSFLLRLVVDVHAARMCRGCFPFTLTFEGLRPDRTSERHSK